MLKVKAEKSTLLGNLSSIVTKFVLELLITYQILPNDFATEW